MKLSSAGKKRKAAVRKEQEKLYENVTVWSSLPPEHIFNDVILPELFSERLVEISDPSFGPIVIATYRVCEAAAAQAGINLAVQVSPEILEIVEDAGDLYR